MSRMYRNKLEYINNLKTILDAREDFKDLEYKKHPSNGSEYLILSAITGEVFMLNVTGYSEAHILHCLAEIECNGFNAIDNLVVDRAERLELGKLFN